MTSNQDDFVKWFVNSKKQICCVLPEKLKINSRKEWISYTSGPNILKKGIDHFKRISRI